MKKIPVHLQPGLNRYFEAGIRTGGFLQACLENNIAEAEIKAADPGTRNSIPAIFEFLENRAPDDSWGSPRTVEAWIEQGGKEGWE